DAIVAVGPDGQTVTVWNPAAERMFGWRPGEIVGRPLATIADPRSEAERDLVMERLRNGESPSLVTRRRRKDGTELDVQINYSAIVDEAGRIGGAMGIITDVTARRAGRRAQAGRA